MKNNKPSNEDQSLPEIIIPKENAVFWMDDQGRWHNRHGRFEHKRIIDYFNRSIRHDVDGYYLTQVRGKIREKVYFPFDDTPLFVFRIIAGDPLQLVLNTGQTLPLDPTRLFVRADQLYQRQAEEVIKFSERTLMDLAPYLEETSAGLEIRMDGQRFPIPDEGRD
jgi:hypothetical protein